MTLPVFIAACAAIFFLRPASGVTLYSEGSSGDLPDDYRFPQTLAISDPGSYRLFAQTAGGAPDFFTLEIGSGLVLESIDLVFAIHPLPGNATFLGFQPGATLDRPPDELGMDDLTFGLFSAAQAGTDIFSAMRAPGGGAPDALRTGSYAFWLNELEPEPAAFALDFVVLTDPVPEASPAILLLTVVCCATFRRQRRKKRPFLCNRSFLIRHFRGDLPIPS